MVVRTDVAGLASGEKQSSCQEVIFVLCAFSRATRRRQNVKVSEVVIGSQYGAMGPSLGQEHFFSAFLGAPRVWEGNMLNETRHVSFEECIVFPPPIFAAKTAHSSST